MKNECSIVQDILPLYVEDMVSEDTAGFVKEHLRGCPECRAELKKLREPVTVQLEPDINAAPLKRLKKTLLMKKNADHLMHGCRTAGTAAVRHFASYRTGIF